MKNVAQIACVRNFKEKLSEAGYALEARLSPRRLSLTALNEKESPPRFVLDFSPGSSLKVLDAETAQRMLLVQLIEPSEDSSPSLCLLGQDESMIFAQPVPGLSLQGPVETVMPNTPQGSPWRFQKMEKGSANCSRRYGDFPKNTRSGS